MSATQVRNYKNTLLAVSELMAKSKQAIHRRVKLLVSVFTDEEFRADNAAFDDFQLAEILDTYLEDVSVSFLEARAILDVFPDERHWAAKSLRDLYDDASKKTAVAAPDKPERTRRSVTVKEFEAETAKVREATARCTFLESHQQRIQDELTEMRAENRKLLIANAMLEGRIVELERASRKIAA